MTGHKVYRAQRLARVLGLMFILGGFIVGEVTAIGSPSDPGKGGTIGVVLGVAVGIFAILLSLWAGRSQSPAALSSRQLGSSTETTFAKG